MSRVLVTGGAGFIGSHVVDGLLARDIDVVVLDNLTPAAHADRPAYLREHDVRYLFEDVRDMTSVERALRGCDGVAHFAAMVGLGVDLGDLPDYVSNNDGGMAALLAAMRSTGFDGPSVLASSMVVYGEGRYRCDEHGVVRPEPRTEEALLAGRFEPPCPTCGGELRPEAVPEDARPDPRNVYAATKLHQEHLGLAWMRETGLPVTALRYHNVYGPRMPRNTPYAGVASIFRSALEDGRSPQVFEDGGQLRDFIHVRDVARATLAPLVEAVPATVYNVGSDTPHSVGQMSQALSDAFGADAPRPEITGAFRLGDVRHVFADSGAIWSLVSGQGPVAFDEGMHEFATAPLRVPLV